MLILGEIAKLRKWGNLGPDTKYLRGDASWLPVGRRQLSVLDRRWAVNEFGDECVKLSPERVAEIRSRIIKSWQTIGGDPLLASNALKDLDAMSGHVYYLERLVELLGNE